MTAEIHGFYRGAIVLGFRGIEELAVTAGRREPAEPTTRRL